MSIPLQLSNAALFFDLSGTILEPDQPMTARAQAVLTAVGARVERLVMVTAQPRDDQQVAAMLEVLAHCRAADTAYVTGGGLRLVRRDGRYVPDRRFADGFCLDHATVQRVRSVAAEALSATGATLLIPIRVLDGVVVRLNVDPIRRQAMVMALRSRLPALTVGAEGRTSIYVSRAEMNKATAVARDLADRPPRGSVYFIGNEVAEGNDRPLLGVDGIEVLAVGPCGTVPAGARCRSIGGCAADVLTVLEGSA